MEKECKKICNLHCVPDDKFIDGLIEVMDYTSNAKVKNLSVYPNMNLLIRISKRKNE